MTTNVTDQAQGWLQELFAPWVQALNLQVVLADGGCAQLRLPFSPELCRQGGTVCGQAFASAADTAMVFAVSSQVGNFVPMTTVNLNINFMRAAAQTDVLITARVVKPGRTLMFGNIDMTDEQGKLLAQATTSYMLL